MCVWEVGDWREGLWERGDEGKWVGKHTLLNYKETAKFEISNLKLRCR